MRQKPDERELRFEKYLTIFMLAVAIVAIVFGFYSQDFDFVILGILAAVMSAFFAFDIRISRVEMRFWNELGNKN